MRLRNLSDLKMLSISAKYSKKPKAFLRENIRTGNLPTEQTDRSHKHLCFRVRQQRELFRRKLISNSITTTKKATVSPEVKTKRRDGYTENKTTGVYKHEQKRNQRDQKTFYHHTLRSDTDLRMLCGTAGSRPCACLSAGASEVVRI